MATAGERRQSNWTSLDSLGGTGAGFSGTARGEAERAVSPWVTYNVLLPEHPTSRGCTHLGVPFAYLAVIDCQKSGGNTRLPSPVEGGTAMRYEVGDAEVEKK